jgi:hypothetical protein
MKRVYMLYVTLGLCAVYSWGQSTNTDQFRENQKLIFFDLWKLDYWDNLELAQGEPKWVADISYTDPGDPPSGVYFPSVLPPKSDGKWLMLYSIRWSPFQLMVAESDDGLHWHPLEVNDIEPVGGKIAPHHVFTLPSGEGSGVYIDPKSSDGYRYRIFGRQHGKPVLQRALTDPEHLWHKIAKNEGKKRYLSEAVTLVSKDGLNWHLRTGNHWNWEQAGWFPEPPVFVFWNARTQQHVMTVRPGWGDRRQCLRTTADMRSWSDPELLFQPDALDTASPIGMYALPVLPLDNCAGFVGLLWIFHNSSSEPVNSFNQFFGTMDAEIVFSYDGSQFRRTLRKPFLRRNTQSEFGCSQVRPCSIVETESEIRIYSEGHCAEHGREGSAQRQSTEPLCAMIVHTLRKDGWMYLRSRGDWARFQTKPFTLLKPTIRVNLNARHGEMLFQLTDEKSQPLGGFSFDDCIPVRQVDTLNHELVWREADLHTVINKVLRLEVKFRNVNIYSFVMDHHFLDAMDQWLLKDGKPIDTRLFDY